MHYRLELEAESVHHDQSRVSVWQLRLRIYFQQCRYELSLYRSR
jgi:hypothetical protein